MGALSWLFGPDVKKLKEAKDIAGLHKALSGGSSKSRAAAAHALGELRAKDSAPALVAALDDRVAEVRRAAAGALADVGTETCVAPLTQHLQDPDPDVRVAVIRALGRVGTDATADAVIPLLEVRDPRVSLAARVALRRWSSTGAVAAALARFRLELREHRHARATDWWRGKGAQGKICDVCSQPLSAGSGYLLDSSEMADSDAYIQFATRLRMSAENATGRFAVPGLDRTMTDMMFGPVVQVLVTQDVMRTRTPWMVCDACHERFFD